MMEGRDTNGLRGRIEGFRRQASADRAATAGLIATAVWLVLVLGFWLLAPATDGARSGAARLATLAGIVLPVALIWLAAGTARALAGLRDEAHDLRAQLLALRAAGYGPADAPTADDLPSDGDVRAARAAAPPAPRPTPRAKPAAARPAARVETPQPSLDLGAPPPVDIPASDLIAAVNFPDGPDDHHAIAAMRHALTDPETARLIRSAQDVVTLLATRGLYMDDLPAPDAPAEVWRRLAEGARGPGLGPLAQGVTLDPDAAEALAEALRSDEVFRDTAHHFLRHWDRMLTRTAPGLDDAQLMALTATRSGRAFTTLAQATGMLG